MFSIMLLESDAFSLLIDLSFTFRMCKIGVPRLAIVHALLGGEGKRRRKLKEKKKRKEGRDKDGKPSKS